MTSGCLSTGWRGVTGGERVPAAGHRSAATWPRGLRRCAAAPLAGCAGDAAAGSGGGWGFLGDEGPSPGDFRTSADCAAEGYYDEILLATGHSFEPSTVPFEPEAPLIPAVFPVAAVAAGGSRARRERASRSAAWRSTFIDAALALTEGRGGTFERHDHLTPGCATSRRPVDVGSILPFSLDPADRCLPSPGRVSAAGVPRVEAIRIPRPRRIQGLSCSTDAVADLAAIVSATAAAALAAGDGHPRSAAGHEPRAQMERALAVGAGRGRPDLAWALGQAWRSVYPAVVTCFSGRRWGPGEALRFRRLTAELERVAFGPAPRQRRQDPGADRRRPPEPQSPARAQARGRRRGR